MTGAITRAARAVAVVVAIGLLAVLVRLAGPPEAAAVVRPSGLPATAPALARFYDQTAHWFPCDHRFQCAWVSVPLDYRHPDGRQLDLRLLRHRASGHRIGDLFVNPGGPAESGLNYAAGDGWPAAVSTHFDVIGFDPRGVMSSGMLLCGEPAWSEARERIDPVPDARSIASYSRNLASVGRACLRSDPELLRHMSTAEGARDLDILRGVLRDSRLNYYGASYGTLLGAAYADRFPGHVGRMVLDGAVDPALPRARAELERARSFQLAWTSYERSCTALASCPLGRTVAQAEGRLHALATAVTEHPWRGQGWSLTRGILDDAIVQSLYSREDWAALTVALGDALRYHDGGALDRITGRSARVTSLDAAASNAFLAITCLDQAGSLSPTEAAAELPAFHAASPDFGTLFAYQATDCGRWPVAPVVPPRALHAEGAPPIVVIGTTRDPATPVGWARRMAAQLGSSRLIVRDGDGHLGYGRGNDCVDRAVGRFLTTGLAPGDLVDPVVNC